MNGAALQDTGELQQPPGCSTDDCLVSAPGVILTRPLVFDQELTHLFVNVEIRRAGFFQVEVLRGNTTLCPANASTVGPILAGSAARDDFSSTRARVVWPGGVCQDLSAVAGQPMRLRFYLSAASLFSFWFSSDGRCGASRGYLGGGGPGAVGGRDQHGACA